VPEASSNDGKAESGWRGDGGGLGLGVAPSHPSESDHLIPSVDDRARYPVSWTLLIAFCFCMQ
jgi:hypothetical protein